MSSYRSIDMKKKQINSWINRCKKNLIEFKRDYNIDIDGNNNQDKIDFIRRQYYLLYMLNNFLTGSSKVEGIERNK